MNRRTTCVLMVMMFAVLAASVSSAPDTAVWVLIAQGESPGSAGSMPAGAEPRRIEHGGICEGRAPQQRRLPCLN